MSSDKGSTFLTMRPLSSIKLLSCIKHDHVNIYIRPQFVHSRKQLEDKMSPPKIQVPVVASLKLSSSNIVHGCPGVPRSIPRIETTIELRPAQCKPFRVRSVGVELRTIQRVIVPSTIGSNDTIRDYKIYEDPMVFRPPIGEFSQEIIGIDIPVLIPLPRDIISSGTFPRWNATTRHMLYVKVICGDSFDTEVTYVESFPVVIKLYDTLPLYRQFNEPIFETQTSGDQQVLVDLSLPVSCVGPKDDIILFTKVMTNSAIRTVSRKLRLNKVTVQIKEILECHEGGLPAKKENKIFTKSEEFNTENNNLNTQGISSQFQFGFPSENDFLQMFTNKEWQYTNSASDNDDPMISIANYLKNKNIDVVDEGIPVTHIQSFTTLGKLFSIRFEAVLKIKLIHGRNLETRIPITVSPYDRISSEYLLQWIMDECEISRAKFSRNLINKIAETSSYDEVLKLMKSFISPPIVYSNTKRSWFRLGYNGDLYRSKSQAMGLTQYID